MASASKLISRARRFCNVTTDQWSDNDAVDDLNELKDKVWSAFVSRTNEDYGWEQWTIDTDTALQSEYLMPEVSSSLAGAKKIKDVGINYDGSTYKDTGALAYRKATQVDPSGLKFPWSYYVENQSQEYPLFYVSDKSFFIAPAPRATQIGTGRIQITGIRKVPDWTISTTSADIEKYFPIDQHEVLMFGLHFYAFLSKQQRDDAMASLSDFNVRLEQACLDLSDRVVAPFYAKYPTEIDEETTGSPLPLN